MRCHHTPRATGKAYTSRMRLGAFTVILIAGFGVWLAPVQAARPQTTAGLRLLVPSIPPSIVDPEAGTTQPVAGGNWTGVANLSLAPVPGGAIATAYRRGGESAVMVRPDGSAHVIASGSSVYGAWNADAAWTLRHASAGGCVLRLVPGGVRESRVRCGWLVADGAAGAVIGSSSGQVLVDHQTGRVLARVSGEGSIAPLRGDLVLENAGSAVLDGSNRLSLLHLHGGRRRALRWPSALPDLDGVVAAPRGALVAVGFAAPGGNPQGADLFLLDTRTGRFRHVPGFPVSEDLKWSSVAWSPDGRLVMTVRLDGVMRLGVYQPGDASTAFSSVTFPAYAGSDAFVPLRAR